MTEPRKSPKEARDRPPQINIYPSDETLIMLDEMMEQYGKRHRNARTRSAIVSEVLELYLPFWTELMAERDRVLEQHLKTKKEEVKRRQR